MPQRPISTSPSLSRSVGETARRTETGTGTGVTWTETEKGCEIGTGIRHIHGAEGTGDSCYMDWQSIMSLCLISA